MERDIDRMMDAVRQRLPSVEVAQWRKSHPADDDGIWWFKLPRTGEDIQLESTYGNCPFVVETNELCCDEARRAETVAEAVSMIVEYLDSHKEQRCLE
jgi:hypothetical protein